MIKQRLSIDCSYYEIDEILEGGMGRVMLLTRLNALLRKSTLDSILERSDSISNYFRVVDRDKIAAKTVKEESTMSIFQRECELWLTFAKPGIVPLLKVVKLNDKIFALMPRYSGNLRGALNLSKWSDRREILKMFETPLRGLQALYQQFGIVHQDLKPENILLNRTTNATSIFISDWGMANVQASMLSQRNSELSNLALETMSGWGTLPYMSPERFSKYRTNKSADIFSLGVVFFEIICGQMPYDLRRPLPEQIISGESYWSAAAALKFCPKNISNLVLAMIHPDENRRLSDYSLIIKTINSL